MFRFDLLLFVSNVTNYFDFDFILKHVKLSESYLALLLILRSVRFFGHEKSINLKK